MKISCLLLLFSLALLTGCTDPTPPEIKAEMAKLPDKIDYSLHVKPLLSDRCFACHGPDKNKQQAGLRLDIKEAAYETNKESGKRAIVPGNLGSSEVFQRLISADPHYQMPTPESHLSLNNEEKALIIKWIQQGAEYKEHWAFVAPQKPELPAVKDKSWTKNEIDFFTLAKMEKKGVTPSPEADKTTLLRRVSFDLTGLPPTPQEIDNFLADKSPNAYEKTVDRLLQSPHLGERLAAEWLDVARYADSHGYQDDGMRNAFPYRDWVIKAFNQNLPWDKFVTWQLAGDLLPNPTTDQLTATCFNRNHSQSQEGGIIDEEYRTEYVADRVNTFSKSFLGLTMECARCHDHKYDPISQKDYYSMFAFFNQNKESGEVPYNGEASPSTMLPDPETAKKLDFIRNQIQPIAKQLTPENTAYKQGFREWQAAGATKPEAFKTLDKNRIAHFTFDESNDTNYTNLSGKYIKGFPAGDKDKRPALVSGKFGKARQLRGDCGIDFLSEAENNKAYQTEVKDRYYKGLNFERNMPFSVSVWFNVLKKGIKGPLFNRNNGEFEGFRGYDVSLNADGTLTVLFSYVYPANCIELRTTQQVPVNQWFNLALTYDGSARAPGIRLFLNGKQTPVKTITDHLTKSILHGEKKSNWNYMPFEIGKNFRQTMDNLQVDELSIYNRRLSALEVESLFTRTDAVTANATPDKLYEFYLWNYDPSFADNLQKISALRLEETQLITDVPEVMVMQELPRDQYRKTFILARGAYDAPTKTEVHAATPDKFLKFDEQKYPSNRLGLAAWLNDPKHPLAARVAVNRFWMLYFGRGIVKTQEDWGNQGDLPTHPELLDWLAVRFRESGWNVKALLKMMVMSATYRQTSLSKTSLEKDPDNLLYSRGTSYRLPAEQIRDNVLAASGLLVRKIGGKSVYPYQPAGLWEALATRNKTKYEQGKGEDLYRRSMYTIWKRSSPPPSMMTFDVPDRYFCTVRRQKTSTPLQSLVLMNDPQYLEASRKLGERMMKEGGTTPAQRITFAYKALVGRPPRANELTLLTKMYAEELGSFQVKPVRVVQLLSTGESALDNTLNTKELAACMVIASTLTNFEETVMKR